MILGRSGKMKKDIQDVPAYGAVDSAIRYEQKLKKKRWIKKNKVKIIIIASAIVLALVLILILV